MTTYAASYKSMTNGTFSEINITGTIFSTANEDINFYHKSNEGFASRIINAVVCELSENGEGLFLNGIPVILLETSLVQSNANGAFAVLIGGNLYPISTNIKKIA